MLRKAIYYIHWALFFLFAGMSAAAFVAWAVTESLEVAAIIATGAALIATTSAFLERLFPGREGK